MKKIIKMFCILVLAFSLSCGSITVEAKTKKTKFEKTIPSVSVIGNRYTLDGKPLVVVSWSKVKGATGYKIYKKLNGKYKLIKTVNSKCTSVSLKRGKNVNIGTYYVRAYKVVKGKKVYSKLGHNEYVYE